MKLHISTFALLASAIAASGTNIESTDTLLKVNEPSQLIITESKSGITVNINNNDNNNETILLIADYNKDVTVSTNINSSPFKEITFNDCAIGVKSNSHWDVICGGFNLGLINSVDQPSEMGLQWSKSIEIGWLNALAARYSNRSMSLSLGLGFDWRNYNMTNTSHYMVKDRETGITLQPYPETSKPGHSRIKIFSLGFPLLYTQKIPGTTLALTTGGILNLNTHASVFTTYENELGYTVEEYAEGIHHRRVSYDLYGAIKFYKGVGLYIRYSPQTVLKGAMTPQFKPLSIGFSFFM